MTGPAPAEAAPTLAEGTGPAEIASFFGGEGARCFGWFHRPVPERARDLGVVICPPFGYEAMCAHRSLRHLAVALCELGFPVLRFDYHGTGNSPGGPTEPARVRAWLESVAEASGWLRRSSGASRLCLFGLRLGGTLAAAAALRQPVEALALWAPFPSGKAFVRELRAFQTLKGTQTRSSDPGGLEIAGYPLSPATVSDLSRLDLLAVAARPAARALFLPRDDLAGDGKLADHLQRQGTEVQRLEVQGYAAMMRDTNESEVPEQAIAAVAAWLAPLAAAGSLRLPPPPEPQAELLALGDQQISERPIRFGPEGRLFGVLTSPAAEGPRRPAVLFLNVGANHHVGPNRMHVVQARSLALRGFTSLRFDVGGLGDSRAAPGQRENQLYSLDSVADVRLALDLTCTNAGIPKAALVGLCSGAFLAFHAGAADPRVSGEVLINQQTFHWREGDSLALVTRRSVSSSRHYRRSLLKWETWRRLLTFQIHVRLLMGALLRALGARLLAQLRAARSFLSGGGWEHSPVTRELRRLLGRGARLLLVFGDTDGGIDVMEHHLGFGARKLAGEPGFQLEIIEGPDHTFTPVWSQLRLEQLLEEWLGTLPC